MFGEATRIEKSKSFVWRNRFETNDVVACIFYTQLVFSKIDCQLKYLLLNS
jgi:hypothetical protein